MVRGGFRRAHPSTAWRLDAVADGQHALVVAPTGSGKTLAAFLWALDQLAVAGPPDEPARRCRMLYISPLKALAVDVERNLRSPLAGIRQAALSRFLPAWPGISCRDTRRGESGPTRGVRGAPTAEDVLGAVEQLTGAPVPASALESLVLPVRFPGYFPALLDELTISGGAS